MNQRILLIEDDPSLGMVLQEHLQMNFFDVTRCTDGEAGLTAFHKENFDLCLVDIMMPKKDGLSFVREIRSSGNSTPIIFLTAKSLREDKIEGFKAGCDDYITKPFSSEELMLRIKAILRRGTEIKDQSEVASYQIGIYTFYPPRQILKHDTIEKKLTTKEADLLTLLCKKKNKTVSRNEALREIWNDEGYFAGRSMDVYISKLRKYLSEDDSVEIMGIHGKGFRLVVGD